MAGLANLEAKTDRWMLEQDRNLIGALQQLSAQVADKTKALGDKLDTLVGSAAATQIRLQNTVNDFLLLANTQFVENRVYDLDDDEVSLLDAKIGGLPI